MRDYRNNDPSYGKFLHELGVLLFTSPPFHFDHGDYPPIQTERVIRDLRIVPARTDIDRLLCQGISLNLGEPYIVITTKIRVLSKKNFLTKSPDLWRALRKLSEKYKIVILGEQEVEISKEYQNHKNEIWSIYEQIVANLPADRVVDLTVPALGITSPTLRKVQQDCLIMKQAKFTITFGIGGNLWLAVASGNCIGYRTDGDYVTDLLVNPEYPGVFLTRDWKQFISKLEEQ